MSQTEAHTQPQQSWAAWILDAYANSIDTSHEDSVDDSVYEATAEPLKMGNATSTETSSPYGPYIRSGRGGAGNFTWQSQQPIDPEIQAPRSLKEKRNVSLALEHIDTAAAMHNSQAKRNITYPRVGRGGAGNVIYTQSNEIQQSPTAATFAKSPTITSSPAMYSGRGGSGNYIAAKSINDSARQAKEQKERAEAERCREEAQQQVQNLLQPPTHAYTGLKRRSTLPDDLEVWS